MSTTTVLAAATGLVFSISINPVPPKLVPQHSSSALGSGSNGNCEEEVLVGLVDQITPVSTKRSSKDSRDTEQILNLLKMGNEQTQNTLEQIDSTLSAFTPDLKKSRCLWMEPSVKKIDPSLWRSF